MKINWKIRFTNKIWLTTFVTAFIPLIYQAIAVVKSFPNIDQETLIHLALSLIAFLALIGIVIDPTTEGTDDSERALTYGNIDYSEHKSMGKGTAQDDEVTEVYSGNEEE